MSSGSAQPHLQKFVDLLESFTASLSACSLGLLSEAVKSILIVSDTFLSKKLWLQAVKILVAIYKNHPAEDLLILRFLVPGAVGGAGG
jgi:hypothetical protein